MYGRSAEDWRAFARARELDRHVITPRDWFPMALFRCMLAAAAVAGAVAVEYNVTMRDGVKLRTSVDFPSWTPPTGGANLTAVLDRSPYGGSMLRVAARGFGFGLTVRAFLGECARA